MINNTKNQIVHIFLPALVKILTLIVLYTLINILVFHQWGLLDLSDDVTNIFIPMLTIPIFIFIFLKQPFLVFRYKEGDNDRGFPSKFLIIVLFGISTCLLQFILSEKVAKVSNLTSIDDIHSRPATKYYTFEEYYIDKELLAVTPKFSHTGRFNSRFQMKLYVTTPIFQTMGQSDRESNVFLGLIYHDDISSNLDDEEKEAHFQRFINDSYKEFLNNNLYATTYFERLKNFSDRNIYLEQYQFLDDIDQQNAIVLIPHKDSYDNSVSDLSFWWMIVSAFSVAALFIFLVRPEMDTDRWRSYYKGEKLYDSHSFSLPNFLLPATDYIITPILVTTLLTLYTLMVVTSFSFISFESELLINWGANFGPKLELGEWWRLISSVFLHAGAMHLVFNVYALYLIGMILELTLKPIVFLLLFLITGCLASLTSYWWNEGALSVGASGAVFGMFGVYLSFLTTGKLSSEQKGFLSVIGALIAINLLMGVMVTSGIDNGAHIGGLISGCFFGLLVSPFIPNKSGLN